jgi:P-type Ca2+ transporter type 2C
MGKKKEEVVEEAAPKTPWHAMELDAVYKELGKDSNLVKVGLTTAEAEDRLAKYGENKLSEKRKVTLWERIYKQIANVLVGVLVFVAGVSAVRAATSTDSQVQLTNWIQVGLILFVIT